MDSIERLIACLGKLPGVGKRSAERMAVRLLRRRDGLLPDLVAALQEAGRTTCLCSRCGCLTYTEADPCRLCTSPDRDGSVLCVVEDPNDIILIERSGGYRGRYHALMGRISPARGEGPDSLRVSELVARVDREKFQEIILALSTDMEGESTASYLSELLRGKAVKITRLASGLPAGSGIVYADPVTLARAIKGRVKERD